MRLDKYAERHLSFQAQVRNAPDLPVSIPYSDVEREALKFLLGDIAHAVLDPGYFEEMDG
jgi:hypothetical protein